MRSEIKWSMQQDSGTRVGEGTAGGRARTRSCALFVCIALLMFVAGGANATDDEDASRERLYVSVFGGYANFDDADQGLGTNVEMSTDDGFTAGGAVGIRGKYYRVEGALDYVEGQFTSLESNGMLVSGSNDDFTVFSIMGNVYLETRLPYFSPYIGAGLGIGFVETDFESIPGITADDHGEELVWNVMAGAAVPLYRGLEFFTGYRFFAMNDTDDLLSHQVQVGLRFTFSDVDQPTLWKLIDPYMPDMPEIYWPTE